MSRFIREQYTSVATVFSLAIIPFLVAGGIAIDWFHAKNAQSALQRMVDAAAYRARGDSWLSESELRDLTVSYLSAGKNRLVASPGDAVTVTRSGKNGSWQIGVAARVDTKFLALAGVKTLNISARSSVPAK